jgi:hypothetical protein
LAQWHRDVPERDEALRQSVSGAAADAVVARHDAAASTFSAISLQDAVTDAIQFAIPPALGT